jgi:tetrahydrodipicolinate N-succinyltransferase
MSSLISRLSRLILPHLLGPERWARRLGVSIGTGCRIYITQWGSEPFLISLGSRVTVTSGVKLLTHDGATWLVREAGFRYQRFGRICVGDDVFIGVNSIVMPGVTIGSRVIVGSGSVVTKDVPDGVVVAGNPARMVSTFDDYRAKVLRTCASDSDLPTVPYEERIKKALLIQSKRV